MLLGKRPRPPMRRTTSMREFEADLVAADATQPSDQEKGHQHQRERQRAAPVEVDSRYMAAMQSPRAGARRNSGDFTVVETAAFLRACGLCNRRLAPARDIFMYRGEIAFCSLECRQQQMNLDERKEKCLTTSMKKGAPPSTTAGSEAAGSGEAVVAA